MSTYQNPASTYTTAMDPNSTTDAPKVSRKWSEEAVRGSVQSSIFRFSSASPAHEEESPAEDNTNLNLIAEWLSHQEEPSDPSTIVDAVSELTTPLSSPMTSFGSPTFETPAGLSRPTVDTLMPPSSSTKPQKRNPRKRPREPTVDSTENDLLGVGAFAEGQRPR